jgi:hypothetical protein
MELRLVEIWKQLLNVSFKMLVEGLGRAGLLKILAFSATIIIISNPIIRLHFTSK